MINALLTLEQGDPSMYPLTHEYNVHNCTAQLAIKQLPSALHYQQYFLRNLSRLEITQYPGLWLPPPVEVTPGSPNTDNLKIHELLVRAAGLFQTPTGGTVPHLFTESMYRNGSLILLFERLYTSTVLFNLKTLRDMLSNWLDSRVMENLSITIPGVTYLNGHGTVHPSEFESMLASAVNSAQSRADTGDDSQVEKLMAIIGLAQSTLRPAPQELPPKPATNGNVDQEAIAQGVLQALQQYGENNLLGTIGVGNQETVSSSLTSMSEERITSIFATSLRRVLMMDINPTEEATDDDSTNSGSQGEAASMRTNQMTLLQMALGANLGDTANTQRRVAAVLSDLKSDMDKIMSSLHDRPVSGASALDLPPSEILDKVNFLCDRFGEESDHSEELSLLRDNYAHMRGCMEESTKVWDKTLKFTDMFRTQIPTEYQTPELTQSISNLEEQMRLAWRMIHYEETRRLALQYNEQFEDLGENDETRTTTTHASTPAQSHVTSSDNATGEAGLQNNINPKDDVPRDVKETPKAALTAPVVTNVKPTLQAPPSLVGGQEQNGTIQEKSALADGVSEANATDENKAAAPTSNDANHNLTPPGLSSGTASSMEPLATQPEDQENCTPPDPPTGLTPRKGDPAESPPEKEDEDEVNSEAIYIPPSRIHPDSVAPVDVFLKAPTVATNLPESYVIIKGIPEGLNIFNTHIHDKNEDSWQVGEHRSSIAHLLISTTRGIPGDEEKWLLNGISIQDGTLRLHGNTEFLRHNYTHLRTHIRPWFPEEDAEQIEFTFHDIGNEAGSEGGVHSPIEPVKLVGKMGATDDVSEAAQSATATDGGKVAPTTGGGEQKCSEDNSSDNNAARQNDTDGFNIGKGKSADSTTEGKKRIINGKRSRFERELESTLKK